jgi:hypothetical protein
MIVRLNGGLGNQMFQYAFGISLADRWDETPYFYKVGLDNGQHRAYGLGAFNLPVHFKEPDNMFAFGEPVFKYNPDVYEASRNSYFVGCWQTEKYFNLQLVDESFYKPSLLSKKSLLFRDKILSISHSCSIHVRRTDYTLQSVQKYHGLMGMDYYNKAIEYIQSRLDDVHFFIFSDDQNWCRQHFTKDNMTVVDVNGYGNGSTGPSSEHEDLLLMAECNHAIIPNSSFGWWGAWLQPDNGIKIAPKKWFNKPELAYDDVVPDRWVKL